MISLELATKLKEHGFPQENCEWYWGKEWGTETVFTYHKNSSFDREHKQTCAKPTLSELIKECGKDFRGINRIPVVERDLEEWPNDKEWHAYTDDLHAYGNEPEEAVAELYCLQNPI